MNTSLRFRSLTAALAGLVLPVALSAATTTIYSNADSYIRSDSTSSNVGGDYRLLVGQTASTGANDLRSLLSFDLSSIPANATITSVTLLMRVQDNDTNAAATSVSLSISLYSVTQSWSEASVTWANASTGMAWTTAGGTYDSTALSTASVPTKGATATTYSWGTSTNFVSAVQSAYDANASVSLMLMSTDESVTTRQLVRFLSSDETGTSLQSYLPQLVIEYTVSAVPEPSAYAAFAGFAGLLAVALARRGRR